MLILAILFRVYVHVLLLIHQPHIVLSFSSIVCRIPVLLSLPRGTTTASSSSDDVPPLQPIAKAPRPYSAQQNDEHDDNANASHHDADDATHVHGSCSSRSSRGRADGKKRCRVSSQACWCLQRKKIMQGLCPSARVGDRRQDIQNLACGRMVAVKRVCVVYLACDGRGPDEHAETSCALQTCSLT